MRNCKFRIEDEVGTQTPGYVTHSVKALEDYERTWLKSRAITLQPYCLPNLRIWYFKQPRRSGAATFLCGWVTEGVC